MVMVRMMIMIMVRMMMVMVRMMIIMVVMMGMVTWSGCQGDSSKIVVGYKIGSWVVVYKFQVNH